MTAPLHTIRPLSVESPLRVLVVDDSLVMRSAISRIVNEDPSVAQTVAVAANGQLALARLQMRDIDVVILDIEMPVMDGLTALPKMLAIDPKLVVIMASTLTTRNAEISLKALSSGAKDYVPKPTSVVPGAGIDEFKRDLIEKIRALGARYRRSAQSTGNSTPKPTVISLRPVSLMRPSVVAIGSSTGGPNALIQVLRNLPGPLKIPMFITQHMPPAFTRMLAESISRETSHCCAEAVDGEEVKPGRVYLAPGDFHMTVAREGDRLVIRLNQGPKESFCRPAVDPMLRALSEVYGRNILAVILTGMGQDGLQGGTVVTKTGGNIIAQDEASSVVWGMPGAVAKAGLCCRVTPLGQIANEIAGFLKP